MAELDDDFDPKQRVKEAVWEWTQRLIILAVVFGFGYFAAYLSYGQGPEGAPSLRSRVQGLTADIDRITKEREDLRSKFEVVNPRLDECTKNLTKCRTDCAAKPPTPAP